MGKAEVLALGILVGVLIGVPLGFVLAQLLSRPASVVFERDHSGRVTAIHYAQVG